MIIPDRVVDLKTQKTYEIDRGHEPLGKGAIGVVYPVKGPERDAVVVKIAFPDLSAETLADFVAERKILAELEATQRTPWAHEGQAPEYKDCKIILLERVKPDQQLVQIAKRLPGGVLAEETILQVGWQYAELLETLHGKLQRTTRGDRKVGDLYWDKTKQRLIVLDWNRALPMPKDEQERDPLIRQDLRVFGQLWAQLAMGQAVSTFADPFDDTNPAWQRLSIGARILIFKALNSHTAQGFQDATTLKDATVKQWQDFQRAQSQTKELLADALNLKKHADKESSLSRHAELARQVRVLADLVRRHTTRLPDKQAKELSELEIWAKESEQKEIEQLRAITKQLYQRVQSGSFKEAATLALTEIRKIDAAGDAEALALMALRRWSYLANWAWQGNRNDLVIGETARKIADALDAFEQKVGVARLLTIQEALAKLKAITDLRAAIQDAQRALAESNGLRELPEPMAGEIKPLELELQIREDWLADRHTDAVAQWEELKRIAEDQASDLRRGVLSLLGFDDYVRQREQEHYLERHAAEFKRQADAIFDLLAQSDGWINVSSRLEETIQYYRTNLKDRPGVAQERREDDELLNAIQELDRDFAGTLESRDEANALARIQSIVFPLHRSTLKETLHRQITESAIAHLERLAQGEWLDELEEGRRLLVAIREYGDLTVKEKNTESLEKTATRFAEWKQAYDELSQYGTAQIIIDPDPKYDKILQQAEKARVQLFDRRALATDKVEQHRVSVIRSVREAERMEQQISELIKAMEKLVRELENQSTQFEQENVQLGQFIGIVDRTRADLEDKLQEYQRSLEVKQSATQSAVDTFLENLKEAKKQQKSFPEADAVISRYNQLAQDLACVQKDTLPKIRATEREILKWQNIAAETQKAVQAVQDAVKKLADPQVETASQISQMAMPTLDQLSLASYLSGGLSAARMFNKDETRKYYELAQGQLANATQLEQERFRQLEEAAKWLEKFHQADLRLIEAWKIALNQWRLSALDKFSEVEGTASVARNALSKVFKEKRDWNFWLIAELDEQRLFLERESQHRYAEGLRDTFDERQRFFNGIQVILEGIQNKVSRYPGEDVQPDLAALKRHIAQRAETPNLTVIDLETISNWAKRADEVQLAYDTLLYAQEQNDMVAENLREMKAGEIPTPDQVKKASQSIGFPRDILGDLYARLSSEVFYIFYRLWQDELERTAIFGDLDGLRKIKDDGLEKSTLGKNLITAQVKS